LSGKGEFAGRAGETGLEGGVSAVLEVFWVVVVLLEVVEGVCVWLFLVNMSVSPLSDEGDIGGDKGGQLEEKV